MSAKLVVLQSINFGLVGKEKGLATHRQALLFYPCYPNVYFAFGVKMTSITSAPLNSFCANFWMSFAVILLRMSS